jgi:impB/mucB/samB family
MSMEGCKGVRIVCHVDLDAFYAQASPSCAWLKTAQRCLVRWRARCGAHSSHHSIFRGKFTVPPAVTRLGPSQVEAQAHPQLAGKSIAVLQYNPFGDLKTYGPEENRNFNDSNGSIIALAYGAARDAGVKRNMRAAEAKRLCPELQFVQVPTSNGKADLTSYRYHGQRVVQILAEPVDGVGTQHCSSLLVLTTPERACHVVLRAAVSPAEGCLRNPVFKTPEAL